MLSGINGYFLSHSRTFFANIDKKMHLGTFHSYIPIYRENDKARQEAKIVGECLHIYLSAHISVSIACKHCNGNTINTFVVMILSTNNDKYFTVRILSTTLSTLSANVPDKDNFF